MNRNHATRFLGLTLWLASGLEMPAADITTVSYPYLGVTHIARTGSVPDFPRNVKIHVVKIDTTAPFISFKFTPHSGTRDTIRQTTLQHLNSQGAQLAINGSFFLPFPSSDFNSALVGFAASNGTVYSPFEAPNQNYAIVRDSPAINIDPNNNLSIVHRDPAFSDGTCYGLCQVVDGLHVVESVTIWNAFAGSAQIVTNGVKTIPCYVDASHPSCQLVVPDPPLTFSNSNSFYELINARTSIGLGCDNKTLVVFTVDIANGSSGMRVSEVADLLIRDYGVCNALNMDGSGSTSLAMADPFTGIGSFVNSSSDNPNGRANASGLAVFAVRDLTAPHTTAQATPAPNVNGWNNSDVKVTLSAQDNPGGIVRQIEYFLTGAQTAASQVVSGNTASINLVAEGVTTVNFFATDVAENIESPQSLTVKIDKTRPVILGMPAGCSLWPPDHKLVTVGTVTAADALSGLAAGSLQVTGTSNEGSGDPQSPDIVVTPNGAGGFVVQLRAERSGNSNDRVYTLTATVSDPAGNTAAATTNCRVPHDKGK